MNQLNSALQTRDKHMIRRPKSHPLIEISTTEHPFDGAVLSFKSHPLAVCAFIKFVHLSGLTVVTTDICGSGRCQTEKKRKKKR